MLEITIIRICSPINTIQYYKYAGYNTCATFFTFIFPASSPRDAKKLGFVYGGTQQSQRDVVC